MSGVEYFLVELVVLLGVGCGVWAFQQLCKRSAEQAAREASRQKVCNLTEARWGVSSSLDSEVSATLAGMADTKVVVTCDVPLTLRALAEFVEAAKRSGFDSDDVALWASVQSERTLKVERSIDAAKTSFEEADTGALMQAARRAGELTGLAEAVKTIDYRLRCSDPGGASALLNEIKDQLIQLSNDISTRPSRD